MRTTALLAALTLTCLTSAAWAGSNAAQVMEGPNGAVRGTWNMTIEEGVVSGSARMRSANGTALTYAITGQVKDGTMTAQRVQPSNGEGCIYVGRDEKDMITGTARCGKNSYSWQVRPQAAQ